MSEHKEGRAIDWMQSVRVAAERARVQSFIAWATATDAHKNIAANARRLGVMYLIWNNRFWRAYQPQLGWTPYQDCLTAAKKPAKYDTICHRNHLHISLSWDGASATTSYWTLKALTIPFCRTYGVSKSTTSQSAGDLIAFTRPFRALDTRSGKGVQLDSGSSASCRLGGDRWAGDRRVLRVPMLGRFGLPATGVAVVQVKVTLVGPNAPGRVVVWGGGSRPSGVAVNAATGGGAVVNTRIAADGTINIALTAGDSGVVLDVLGYRPVGNPSPSPTPTPTPTGTPTPTPSPTDSPTPTPTPTPSP